MPYRVVQYQIKAEPIPLGATERTTPDKWQAERPDVPVRRATIPVALLSAAAFVPVVSAAPTPVYVNSQSSEPTRIEHVQYQAKAEPVLVSAPAGETGTSDKWDRGQSQPLAGIRRATEFTAYSVDNSTLLRPERPDVDKWVVRINQPRQEIKRQQHLYPSFFAERLHVAPSAAVSTPIYISAQACEPTAITYFQYQARTTIAGQIDDGLPPTFWLPQISELLRVRPRQRWSESAQPLVTTAGTEVVTLDKWAQRLPDLVSKLKRLHDYSLSLLDPTLRAERASLDKWAQPTNQPQFDLKRQQRLYPTFFTERLFSVPNVESVTVDKWYSQRPEQISTVKRSRDYSLFAVDPRLFTQPERSQIDKWGQLTQQPRFDIKRSQWLYPSLAIDSQFYLIPPAEIIKLDKWNRQYPDVIFRAKRLPDYTYFSIDPTLRAEVVSIDRWSQPQSQPHIVKRGLVVPTSELIAVAESITLDKWLALPAEIRRDSRWQVYSDSVLLVATEPHLFETIAEPIRQRARALILPAPELLLDVPFTDWQPLVENVLPTWKRVRMPIEGASVIRLPDPMPPDVRVHHGRHDATIVTRSTSASVSTARR